jgi:hypothetical protein
MNNNNNNNNTHTNYIGVFSQKAVNRNINKNKLLCKSNICTSACHEGLWWIGGIAPLIQKT